MPKNPPEEICAFCGSEVPGGGCKSIEDASACFTYNSQVPEHDTHKQEPQLAQEE